MNLTFNHKVERFSKLFHQSVKLIAFAYKYISFTFAHSKYYDVRK